MEIYLKGLKKTTNLIQISNKDDLNDCASECSPTFIDALKFSRCTARALNPIQTRGGAQRFLFDNFMSFKAIALRPLDF